jgi:hypothetical protein
MAVLSNTARREVWAEFMRELSAVNEPCGLSKVELRAAVDAIDSWVDANATSLNSAIPQPARGVLTAAQKARILAMVTLRRFRG